MLYKLAQAFPDADPYLVVFHNREKAHTVLKLKLDLGYPALDVSTQHLEDCVVAALRSDEEVEEYANMKFDEALDWLLKMTGRKQCR